MSNYVYGRNDIFCVAAGSAFNAINNASGAATIAAVNAAKHKSFAAVANRARLAATDKEATAFLGYIDRTRRGRYSGSATYGAPLYSSTGPGVEPAIGPILAAAFGAKTIAAGVSVTYGPAGVKYMNEPSPLCCELWGFNPAGVRGSCTFGAIPNKLTLAAGQDSAELTVDFLAYYTLGQDRFANAETNEKGGLTAFPTPPTAPAYSGSELTGFVLALTLDGVGYNPRSASFSATFNRGYRMDLCAADGTEYYGYAPRELMPEFTLDAALWNTDDANLAALLAKIDNRTPFNASLQIGSVAGGIYTLTLKNLIVPGDTRGWTDDDGDDRKALNIKGLRAQATSTSVRDEAQLVLT